MEIILCEDREEAGKTLAGRLVDLIAAKPDLVLGLATGRTSNIAYHEVVRRQSEVGDFSMRHVTTFNTDELVGLKPYDHRSNRYFMNMNLFRHVDIDLSQTHVPRGDAKSLQAECKAYDFFIEASGGLDAVVLGLGHNGHVGFNEPGSKTRSHTRIVDLQPSTLAALSDGRRFKNLSDTPVKAISMGMSTILAAKQVFLIATGLGKAEIVHKTFDLRAGPSVPASLLTNHKGLTVIIDEDAGSRMERSEDA